MNKFVFILVLIFFASCEKDPGLTGDAVGGNLNTLDSLALTAYTIADDPKNALNEGDVALGRLVDTRFGESIASFYTQLRLSTTGFEPGTNPILDSAILVLDIEDTFGPLNNSIDFEVYRLTEAMDAATNYTSSVDLSTDVNLIGGAVGFVFDEDSTLRIPLTNTFGNELLSLFGTTATENNDDFLSYLNGLYVTVEASSGGDGLFDLELTSDATSLLLYFKSDSPDDSLYTFNVGTQALRINQYQNDASGSELEVQLNDLSNHDETLLIGGLQVSKSTVNLPDLSVLEGMVINQAKLSFFQSDYGDPINIDYENPEFLLLTGGKTTDSVQYFLSDYSTSNPTAYGGTPELVDVNGNATFSFSYNIPRFIQRYVNGETDISFLNLEAVNYNNGNRVKLGGGNHPTFPLTLEILYTKP